MDIIKKIENERSELEFRLSKLILFLRKQMEEQTVSDEQLGLLYLQHSCMKEYVDILNRRINDLDEQR
ncbi:crAss001_48 related protein [Limosilactobacillus fermentum]|uniref:crAss001_48 related protein n=1 Tax=Limosilactobacillus fermentum TaxID=1613 RepID=UPI003DA4C951